MLGRTIIRLVLVAVVLAVVANLGGGRERPALRIPEPPTHGVPHEFASIVSGMKGTPRGLSTPAPTAGGRRPFADRGPRRQIARLRGDVARALRAASTPDDRLSVAAWQGVYVSGRRAVAVADLRRTIRTRPGLPFRRLPPARTRLALAREGRRWFVLDVAALRR